MMWECLAILTSYYIIKLVPRNKATERLSPPKYLSVESVYQLARQLA